MSSFSYRYDYVHKKHSKNLVFIYSLCFYLDKLIERLCCPWLVDQSVWIKLVAMKSVHTRTQCRFVSIKCLEDSCGTLAIMCAVWTDMVFSMKTFGSSYCTYLFLSLSTLKTTIFKSHLSLYVSICSFLTLFINVLF